MKDIKQIRGEYDVLTEAMANEEKKLIALIRAGLLDATKLPLLKRALSKEVKILTPAERNIMIELLNALMAQVLTSNPIYTKMRQNVMSEGSLEPKETKSARTLNMASMPSIIVLKRRAIRVYPGGQNIGLYYSQQLDRYIAVPFGEDKSVLSMTEETQLDEISDQTAHNAFAKLHYKARESSRWGDEDETVKYVKKTAKVGLMQVVKKARKDGWQNAGKEAHKLLKYSKKYRDVADLMEGRSQPRTIDGSNSKKKTKLAKLSTSGQVKASMSSTGQQGKITVNTDTQPSTNVNREAIKKRLAAKHQEKMTNVLAQREYLANKPDRYDGDYQKWKSRQTMKRLSKKAGPGKAQSMLANAKKKAGDSLKKYDQYKKDAGEGNIRKDMAAGDNFGQALGRKIYRHYNKEPTGPALEEGLVDMGKKALGFVKRGVGSALSAGREVLDPRNKDKNKKPIKGRSYLPDVADRQTQLRIKQHGVDTDRRRRIDRSYVDPRDKLQENVEVDLGGNTFQLPSAVANKIVSVYQSLNEGNQTKMIEKMQESNESLNRVIAFAIRQ